MNVSNNLNKCIFCHNIYDVKFVNISANFSLSKLSSFLNIISKNNKRYFTIQKVYSIEDLAFGLIKINNDLFTKIELEKLLCFDDLLNNYEYLDNVLFEQFKKYFREINKNMEFKEFQKLAVVKNII